MEFWVAFLIVVVLAICANSKYGCLLFIFLVIIFLWAGKCESDREEQERKNFSIEKGYSLEVDSPMIEEDFDICDDMVLCGDIWISEEDTGHINRMVIERILRTKPDYARLYYRQHKDEIKKSKGIKIE